MSDDASDATQLKEDTRINGDATTSSSNEIDVPSKDNQAKGPELTPIGEVQPDVRTEGVRTELRTEARKEVRTEEELVTGVEEKAEEHAGSNVEADLAGVSTSPLLKDKIEASRTDSEQETTTADPAVGGIVTVDSTPTNDEKIKSTLTGELTNVMDDTFATMEATAEVGEVAKVKEELKSPADLSSLGPHEASKTGSDSSSVGSKVEDSSPASKDTGSKIVGRDLGMQQEPEGVSSKTDDKENREAETTVIPMETSIRQTVQEVGKAGATETKLPEVRSSTSEVTSSASEVTSSASEVTSSTSEVTPSASEVKPSSSEVTISTSEVTSSTSEVRDSLLSSFPATAVKRNPSAGSDISNSATSNSSDAQAKGSSSTTPSNISGTPTVLTGLSPSTGLASFFGGLVAGGAQSRAKTSNQDRAVGTPQSSQGKDSPVDPAALAAAAIIEGKPAALGSNQAVAKPVSGSGVPGFEPLSAASGIKVNSPAPLALPPSFEPSGGGGFNLFANVGKAIQMQARHLVSQNKRRYQEDGFDLDLSYITENILAMGFPAGDISSGFLGLVEGFYRNHMGDVVQFLEAHHRGRYKVFNLCSERLYDASLLPGGTVACFPFDDHNCPPLHLIPAFCQSAHSWLRSHMDNVVVVHCKAGMGRTGIMIASLLLYLNYFPTSQEAIQYFNTKRAVDGKALVLPSQQRYVRYFEQVLKRGGVPRGVVPKPRTCFLRGIRLHRCPYWIRPAIVVESHTRGVLFSTKSHPKTRRLTPEEFWYPAAQRKGVMVFALPGERSVADLEGDFKLTFLDRQGDFYCWLNTDFVGTRLLLNTKELDQFEKRSLVSPGFIVEVVVIDEEAPLPSSSASTSASSLTQKLGSRVAEETSMQAPLPSSASTTSSSSSTQNLESRVTWEQKAREGGEGKAVDGVVVGEERGTEEEKGAEKSLVKSKETGPTNSRAGTGSIAPEDTTTSWPSGSAAPTTPAPASAAPDVAGPHPRVATTEGEAETAQDAQRSTTAGPSAGASALPVAAGAATVSATAAAGDDAAVPATAAAAPGTVMASAAPAARPGKTAVPSKALPASDAASPSTSSPSSDNEEQEIKIKTAQPTRMSAASAPAVKASEVHQPVQQLSSFGTLGKTLSSSSSAGAKQTETKAKEGQEAKATTQQGAAKTGAAAVGKAAGTASSPFMVGSTGTVKGQIAPDARRVSEGLGEMNKPGVARTGPGQGPGSGQGRGQPQGQGMAVGTNVRRASAPAPVRGPTPAAGPPGGASAMGFFAAMGDALFGPTTPAPPPPMANRPRRPAVGVPRAAPPATVTSGAGSRAASVVGSRVVKGSSQPELSSFTQVMSPREPAFGTKPPVLAAPVQSQLSKPQGAAAPKPVPISVAPANFSAPKPSATQKGPVPSQPLKKIEEPEEPMMFFSQDMNFHTAPAPVEPPPGLGRPGSRGGTTGSSKPSLSSAGNDSIDNLPSAAAAPSKGVDAILGPSADFARAAASAADASMFTFGDEEEDEEFEGFH